MVEGVAASPPMKLLALAIYVLASGDLELSGAPTAEAARENQKAAVQEFPELGEPGSYLNALFVERFIEYRRTRPEFFHDDRWPSRLAAECAAEIQRRTAKAKKLTEEMIARRRANNDYPVPEPANTPFDEDPEARKNYLKAYASGYRDWLFAFAPIRCGVGRDPDRDGYNAGAGAAHHDHKKRTETRQTK